jgi:hypothetical protein
MRTASLVEGTPAYAQCIELIKEDIEDFAMTSPEDAARIATNYTDAETIAVMHVCGACGVRDTPRRTAVRRGSRSSPPRTGCTQNPSSSRPSTISAL